MSSAQHPPGHHQEDFDTPAEFILGPFEIMPLEIEHNDVETETYTDFPFPGLPVEEAVHVEDPWDTDTDFRFPGLPVGDPDPIVPSTRLQNVGESPFDIPAERAPIKRARWTRFHADTVTEAVEQIILYLEDTSKANQVIYFDGWDGLAASAVLRAIPEKPPPSLREKFDKVVHVDCSRWKNRRALQKEIALQLELPQQVMAIFDRQDLEDDFNGVDEGSRIEIGEVGTTIHQALQGNRCLVVFHNGSNSKIDLNDFGIPQDRWSSVKVMWTYRGRLRPIPEMKQNMEPELRNSRVESINPDMELELRNSRVESINPDGQAIVEGVDNSHVYLHSYFYGSVHLLQEEAREIVQYTRNHGVSPDIATDCCLYLLWLNSKDGDIMEYNWATHASNYWVCDGIIQQGEADKAWEVGVALHQEIRLEDYSSNKLPSFGGKLKTPSDRWVTYSNEQQRRGTALIVPSESSSFFLAFESRSDHMIASLPNNTFQYSEKLKVLKLSNCSFSFSSPPFRSCQYLRFLGLNLCKDQPQKEEEKQERPKMAFFESMWVLDICNTHWELTLSSKIIEKMATNIREVNVKRGRIWSNNLSWGRLRNLRKLRVIEPTHPWEIGHKEEFIDMVKLELLDLSRNITIQVLPTLSGATSLKTLVLDGCVGLEHVGPEGLPPSLESFSFDARVIEDNNNEAKISRISLAGCARLADFVLRGSLPKLEELDISGTSAKTLDLKDQVVQVPCLQRVILLGCELLRTILWPEKGMQQLRVLCIDTRGREEVRKISPDSLVHPAWKEYCHAYVAIMDMKFVRLLVLRHDEQFCWNTGRFNLNLCITSTSKDNLDKGQSCNKEKITYSIGQIIGPLLQKSLIPDTYCSYTDVTIDKITSCHDDSSTLQFQQLDCHVEIGEGIINTNVESAQGIKAIIFVMNKVESLHVHDNSSITTVIPKCMMSIGREQIGWRHVEQCRVERCPKLHTVFTTDYDIICFDQLETFWAADLPMAHCIWSKGRIAKSENTRSFVTLRSIHLYSCPRLVFVLPLSWFYTLSSLQTLHIVCCGDLRQVFPVEPEFLNEIATGHQKGILEFPKLKHIHLHELPKLQQMCEAMMSAPMLETIWLKGCWSLRCLPAVDHRRRDSRPTVDCEKDWWEKLEWDGRHIGHDPSLYDPRHSQYYKKPQPRGSILR